MAKTLTRFRAARGCRQPDGHKAAGTELRTHLEQESVRIAPESIRTILNYHLRRKSHLVGSSFGRLDGATRKNTRRLIHTWTTYWDIDDYVHKQNALTVETWLLGFELAHRAVAPWYHILTAAPSSSVLPFLTSE